jgi:hypothetical protein
LEKDWNESNMHLERKRERKVVYTNIRKTGPDRTDTTTHMFIPNFFVSSYAERN